MKNKYYKTMFTIFFIVTCAITMVVGRYVKQAVNTFKFNNLQHNRVVLTMNINSSYNELKLTLKQKYSKMLADAIEATRNDFNDSLKSVLGEEYLEKRNKLTELESQIKKERNEFLNSGKYIEGKQKLKELKEKIDATTNEDDKEALTSEFNAELNKLSTLNIQLNNVLKSKREEIDLIKGELRALFNSKKEEIKKEKEVIEQKTKQEIANIITQFNFELKELNDAFAVSVIGREMPFDNGFINDLSAVSKFENECLNENAEENSSVKVELVSVDGLDDVVVLENTSNLKS